MLIFRWGADARPKSEGTGEVMYLGWGVGTLPLAEVVAWGPASTGVWESTAYAAGSQQ